jgi:hypothetical protein
MTVTGRRVSRHTRVAWYKRDIIRKDCTRDKVEGATWRIGPPRKNLWKDRTVWMLKEKV